MTRDKADFLDEWMALRDAQLQRVIDDFHLLRDRCEQERRELIDICLQYGDHATVDAILDHLQRTTATWQQWPREREAATFPILR
jgi:hypothetical protein